jgi:hypothetical protein
MITTSQGRAVPTTLPEKKTKAWIEIPAPIEGAVSFQAKNIGGNHINR